jgi:hypothetical protein
LPSCGDGPDRQLRFRQLESIQKRRKLNGWLFPKPLDVDPMHHAPRGDLENPLVSGDPVSKQVVRSTCGRLDALLRAADHVDEPRVREDRCNEPGPERMGGAVFDDGPPTSICEQAVGEFSQCAEALIRVNHCS